MLGDNPCAIPCHYLCLTESWTIIIGPNNWRGWVTMAGEGGAGRGSGGMRE